MVHDPEGYAIARKIGKSIGGALPPGIGYALFIFDIGTSGSMNYISNASRDSVINAMKEFLVNLELGQAGEERP